MPRDLSALTWMNPLERIGNCGIAARPCFSTSTPRRLAHQRRPAASAVKFAIVPPVTSTPDHELGNPKRSSSQEIDTVSSSVESGDACQPPAF
jgi:hypothetical protein